MIEVRVRIVCDACLARDDHRKGVTAFESAIDLDEQLTERAMNEVRHRARMLCWAIDGDDALCPEHAEPPNPERTAETPDDGKAKACSESAIFRGEDVYCDREEGHSGPHVNRKSASAWTGPPISYPVEESDPHITLPDLLAQQGADFVGQRPAALAAAAASMRRGADAHTVLDRAEVFLEWLEPNV